LVFSLYGWLARCLFGLWVDWLVGWLIGFVGWMVGRLYG